LLRFAALLPLGFQTEPSVVSKSHRPGLQENGPNVRPVGDTRLTASPVDLGAAIAVLGFAFFALRSEAPTFPN